jgi:uroporphyrinogen-III synthase
MTVVLNTRPAEQAAELTSLLRAAGFDVAEAPSIAIVPADVDPIREALCSGIYAWAVLPSQNAGRALVSELSRVKVVCGTSTARALGLQSAISLDRFSAVAALAALTPHIRQGDRVLAPHAAEGRDELVDGLRALGANVDTPIVYRTVFIDDAAQRLRAGGVDVVTVCSPSAVRSIAPAINNEMVVCLGETTAGAARELGLRPAAVAEHTSMAALVEAVANVVGTPV